MKSPRLSTHARLALMAAIVSALTACAPTRDYYEPAPYYEPRGDYYGDYYDYWYYPAVGAYYDPRASRYFYYEHDHWIHARDLPPHYRPYLGRHVTVRSLHDRPYEHHSQHRERYVPEHYRQDHDHRTAPDGRSKAVWIGVPHQSSHEHERDDRRRDSDDRNGNGRSLTRDRDRAHRFAPVEPRHQEPAREIRTAPSENQYREGIEPGGNGQDRRYAPALQHYRERALDTQSVPSRMQSPDSGRGKPVSGAASVKQQDKMPARWKTPEESPNNPEDDARRDDPRNNGNVNLQRRLRAPYDAYENYR